MFSLQSYLKSLKKKQQEMVKKHQQDLGIPETTEKAELAEEPKTDSEDSDLASLARELAVVDEDDRFSPLDSPFIKKVTTENTHR